MEWLTYFDNGKWRLKIGDTEYSGNAVDRLAAYENTGLDPDQIQAVLNDAAREFAEYDAMAPKERLYELAQADKESRCLLLPRKEGATGDRMDKNIWQKIEKGHDSICLTCIHRLVCRSIDNQPCTECSHYRDAAEAVEPKAGIIIETIKNGKMYRICSCCGQDLTGLISWYMPKYCPNCGAPLEKEIKKEWANS